jgi:intraflagellar transport protein 52
LFSCTESEKYHPESNLSGFARWFRRLRATFRLATLTGPITAEKLEGIDILVSPQEKFSLSELETLKDFIHGGGAILFLCDEGGQPAMGTSIDYLLEEYGISTNGDVLVSTSRQTFFHPKEPLVFDGVPKRSILSKVDRIQRTLGSVISSGSNDSTFHFGDTSGDVGLTFVVPSGATLVVRKPAATILSSGKLAYPMQRPVCATWLGGGSRGQNKGRIAVLGSGKMATDYWFDREDNARVLDFIMQWLATDSKVNLYDLDAEDLEIGEYILLQDTVNLAGRPRSSLEEGDNKPKDFTVMFVGTVYVEDTDFVHETFELYNRLMVEKANLSLIAPQFECPLPPLQPSVFPPALSEPPPPALDLFDLELAFSTEQTRLANVFVQCTAGRSDDFAFFVREGSCLCGFTNDKKDSTTLSCKAQLAKIFCQLINFKMSEELH